MDQKAHSPVSGSYTANLLGNIRSHLAGLQGYDVMALELIQNADDAKAESISFDITDQGLLVRNSGRFSYCGDLINPCRKLEEGNYKCDYHRITDVGSGGKLSRSENIGRFGIGFVSTYQVTDHPEIRSSGIKLILQPELGQWLIEKYHEPHGTSFFLPWAQNPDSQARLALGVSHVSASHIDQLTKDLQTVLRKSLLFLRHVRTAEVYRNGTLLLACDLVRGTEATDLTVKFRPSGKEERWHILRADATDAAEQLFVEYPSLKALGRSSLISIGLRIDPEPLSEGLLYAFLPTEQSTGLPLHINADFFPEADRKAVIFAGHQHEHAWNDMLIDTAAQELARDPEGLLAILGDARFWQILGKMHGLKSESSIYPSCYENFWMRMHGAASSAPIALAVDNTLQLPSGLFLPRGQLDQSQLQALLKIDVRTPGEKLKPYQNVLMNLGTSQLTLERLIELLEKATEGGESGSTQVAREQLEVFYKPLWGIINDLLPNLVVDLKVIQRVNRLKALPVLVSEDLYVVAFNNTYQTPALINPGSVASLLPRLAVASSQITLFNKLQEHILSLDLETVATHLDLMCQDQDLDQVIQTETDALRDLYTLFAELDECSKSDGRVYELLRSLPIWKSNRGLISATYALLPGNYSDPTGQADLLDTSLLSASARSFISQKLGVRTQTIEAFVEEVLPTFFNDAGPKDPSKYSELITELSNHPSLVDQNHIVEILSNLPLAPTQDDGWSRPLDTYRRANNLVKVLGDTPHLWLDTSRLPDARSVHAFIDNLGIRQSPSALHLVERILHIAEKWKPNSDAKRASGNAFYALCGMYEESRDTSVFRDAIARLHWMACFPAMEDEEEWHSSEVLFAPFRAEAFESQAKILDFRNTARLKTDLLKDMGMSINPGIELVIGHLRHCIASNEQPHVLVYQVLNERAQHEGPLIASLAGSPCVFVESQKKFVRPNQLYWVPQSLGRYAHTIPGNFGTFKPFFDAIGVKNEPDGSDFIDILLDIVGEYFERSKPLDGQDRGVYEYCLINLSSAFERGELTQDDLNRMRESPCVLNILRMVNHPDEMLLNDSEWHAEQFQGDLDQALCKPEPEVWPLLLEIGVRRLSVRAHVELEYTEGEPTTETEVTEKLVERWNLLARLLHDKPSQVRARLQRTLSEIQAVSFDLVRIQASVQIVDDEVSAPPTSAQAFYDVVDGRLAIARPFTNRSWSFIFSALFHQLMPEESGGGISRLTLNARSLIGVSIEDGAMLLDDAGIPRIDLSEAYASTQDLTSSNLEEIGLEAGEAEDENFTDTNDEYDAVAYPETNETVANDVSHGSGSTSGRHVPATGNGIHQPSSSGHDSGGQTQGNRAGATSEADIGRSGYSNKKRSGSNYRNKARPEHKEQWDRRLLSYVKRQDSSETSADNSYNLSVEMASREAVCDYERERGRTPEPKAQTHPGYDIVSLSPLTGEERIIEVKGINGEWNQTGVGLSRLQFSNAQDYGDRYWLYVVEHAFDPELVCVHPIQSPASQVTSFMFDGNWRDAVTDELADPTAFFIPGVRIKHQDFGSGEILEVKQRGVTKLLKVQFDGKEQVTQNVSLNLLRMQIEEHHDG